MHGLWILPKPLHTSACALDTAALTLDYAESSLLCARSLTVRSKLLPLPTWSRKWKRDSWTALLFGRILKPSLGPSFVVAYASCQAVIPASLSASLASDSATTIPATSGPSSSPESSFACPTCASSRMSKGTYPSDCARCSAIWKRQVIVQRGDYSARLKSAPRTNASESSSWPTASARDYRSASCSPEFQAARRAQARGKTLPEILRYGQAVPENSNTPGNRQGRWPTATVHGNTNGKGMSPTSGDGLRTSVMRWATPKASDPEHSGPNMRDSSGNLPLPSQVLKTWRTPRTITGGAESAERKQELGRTESGGGDLQAATMGSLNPNWVCLLMGIPVGWVRP